MSKQEEYIRCYKDKTRIYFIENYLHTFDAMEGHEVPFKLFPRQKAYFEVGSCSTLGDAQARRLGIRVKGDKENYYPHTLNNTVLASTRALIALIENNYKDGILTIPKVLRPYMGGKEKLVK